MTYLLYRNPLGMSKQSMFWPANRRGSPSKIEGLGSWMKGVKGNFSPCRFGQSPRVFCHALHGLAKPKSLAEHVQIKFGITC
ncbi:hypothetical protein ABE42_15880 [Bacillus thuringiensis]|nr:hypothetical protein [Bacillus thuringiensis]